MRRTLGVVLIALAMPAVLPAAPVAADTTFKTKGPVVTITLQVDVFAGRNVRTGPDGTPIDEYFKKVMEDTWGEAFKKLNSLDCYKLELNLDFELFDVNEEGRDGSHKLYVGTERRGWKGVGWDGAPKETSRNGDGDGTRSFENKRKGDIPANAPPFVVAHEFGHLLGLGDDRKDGAPKPGYGLADVMVGGVPGTDVNQVPVIDTKVLDRIGEVLKKTEQGLPKCQTWNGTIDGFGDNVGICDNATAHSGTFTIGVVDRSAVLTGHVLNEAGTGCGAAGRPENNETDFTLVGEKTRRGFSFTTTSFTTTGDFPPPVELQIAGDHATGSSRKDPGGNGVWFVTLDYEADCVENCDDEPVG